MSVSGKPLSHFFPSLHTDDRPKLTELSSLCRITPKIKLNNKYKVVDMLEYLISYPNLIKLIARYLMPNI